MKAQLELAGAPASLAAAEPLAHMSSEGLLEFGSEMTARFDEQILSSMHEMRAGLDETDVLSSNRQALQTIAAELTEAAGDDSNRAVALTREQFERLRELGVLAELGLDPNLVYEENPPSISANRIDRVDSQLELRQNQLNSAQEQRLLMLQETMRQRSQLGQLLSNILRELGETAGHIVRNIA